MNHTDNTQMTDSTNLEETSERKKRKRWIILLLLIIIILLLLLLKQCGSCPEQPNSGNLIGLEEGGEWNGQLPQNGERPMAGDQAGIAIPGYSQVYGPEVQLINPANNDVYFVYKIYSGETLVYETKLIKPNHVAVFDAASVLGSGRHQVQFKIETYDIETNQPCNGATMNVEIINE